MDLPKASDQVLAQPTRARLFGALDELRRPAGTEELAQRLGLHPNGVRLHLERLCDAGLLRRERARYGRGRPRDMWSIAPDARPGGDPPTAYTDLGRWLARIVAQGKTSSRAVEATGREIGRGLAPRGDDRRAEDRMRSALVSMGFAPVRDANRAGALTYRLRNCPYRDAVRESQRVICTLHRGITRGLLDELSPETELEGFVPRDPYTAGCLIELGGGLADDVAPETPDTAPDVPA
jgi:predicted ArsR family transcriptional regulator